MSRAPAVVVLDGVDRLMPSPPPQALQPDRGPVPEYDPPWHHTFLPQDHPDVQRLKTYREEAWRRGIDRQLLEEIECGLCPVQVAAQIYDLQEWLRAHPA